MLAVQILLVFVVLTFINAIYQSNKKHKPSPPAPIRRKPQTITATSRRRATTITHPAKPPLNPQPKTKEKGSGRLVFSISAFIILAFGSLIWYTENRPTPTLTTRHQQPARTVAATTTPKPTRKTYKPASKPRPSPTTRKLTRQTTTTTKHSNVRSGPGTHYPATSQIPANTKIKPIGRNATGSWIRFTSPNASG